MFIIKYKKIFVSISVFLVLASIAAISIFGLPLGIDFKGGALTEVTYTTTRPTIDEMSIGIKTLAIGVAEIQPTGDTGYFIKTRALSEPERVALLASVSTQTNQAVLKSYTSIGPSVGKELTRKMTLAIIFVSLAIILFIAYAFRNVDKNSNSNSNAKVSSWKYGFIAIITLIHDILIPIGVFAILARSYGVEVDTLFVVAILTVLGLSISDTIVVFDRIRENIRVTKYATFAETVGHSLNEVYTRSINTSATVIIVLLSLFFFGPASTKVFALMMTAGMFFGTYSSIFLASPLLVYAEQWQKNGGKKK